MSEHEREFNLFMSKDKMCWCVTIAKTRFFSFDNSRSILTPLIAFMKIGRLPLPLMILLPLDLVCFVVVFDE